MRIGGPGIGCSTPATRDQAGARLGPQPDTRRPRAPRPRWRAPARKSARPVHRSGVTLPLAHIRWRAHATRETPRRRMRPWLSHGTRITRRRPKPSNPSAFVTDGCVSALTTTVRVARRTDRRLPHSTPAAPATPRAAARHVKLAIGGPGHEPVLHSSGMSSSSTSQRWGDFFEPGGDRAARKRARSVPRPAAIARQAAQKRRARIRRNARPRLPW